MERVQLQTSAEVLKTVVEPLLAQLGWNLDDPKVVAGRSTFHRAAGASVTGSSPGSTSCATRSGTSPRPSKTTSPFTRSSRVKRFGKPNWTMATDDSRRRLSRRGGARSWVPSSLIASWEKSGRPLEYALAETVPRSSFAARSMRSRGPPTHRTRGLPAGSRLGTRLGSTTSPHVKSTPTPWSVESLTGRPARFLAIPRSEARFSGFGRERPDVLSLHIEHMWSSRSAAALDGFSSPDPPHAE